MATTLGQLRDALKSTIENATDLTHVYATVPGTVEPKSVVIVPSSADTRTMGRGVVQYVINAVVVAAASDSEHGQRVLDEMLETAGTQILAAIDATRTLGLTETNAHAAGWDDYGTSEFGERTYYTATIPVVIVTKGN